MYFHIQVYVVDSADIRRMEETALELSQLLEEVRNFFTCYAELRDVHMFQSS